MQQFTIKDNTIKSYNDNTWTKYLEIPESIKAIDYGAFTDCPNIVNVILPKSLEVIGSRAFENCRNLKTVVIPDGVKRIDSMAFKNCVSLDNISIPASVNVVGEEAFWNCRNLLSASVQAKQINDNAFSNCKFLAHLELSYDLEQMKNTSFENCPNLRKIDIVRNGKSYSFDLKDKKQFTIGSFNNFKRSIIETLFESDFPNDKNVINQGEYSYNVSLKKAVVSKNIISIGSMAFEGCTNLEELVLPNSLENIGTDAFKGCEKLKEVYIPDRIKKLETGVFSGCKAIESISIPYDMTVIYNSAFYNCSSLKKVTIRKGAKSFDFDFQLSTLKDQSDNHQQGLTFTNEDLVKFKSMIDMKAANEISGVQVHKEAALDQVKQCQDNSANTEKLDEITARLDEIEKKYDTLLKKYNLLCRIVSMNRVEEYVSFYQLTESELKKIAVMEETLNELGEM